MIQIVSKKEGFRRTGIAHPGKSKNYPDDFFTDEQLKTLKDEPMLVVTSLPDLPKKNKNEAAAARKILMKKNNDDLKSNCDELGIEYPDDATKAVLVDMLIDNSAPPPEE